MTVHRVRGMTVPTVPALVDQRAQRLIEMTGLQRLVSRGKTVPHGLVQAGHRAARTFVPRVPLRAMPHALHRVVLPMATRAAPKERTPIDRHVPLASGHQGQQDRIHHAVQTQAAPTRQGMDARQNLAHRVPPVLVVAELSDRSQVQSRATRDVPPGSSSGQSSGRAIKRFLVRGTDAALRGKCCRHEIAVGPVADTA